MDNEATQKLHFDRRMLKRRNWLKDGELEEFRASLPDVAGKVLAPGEEPEVAKPHAPFRTAPEPVAAPVEPFGDAFSPAPSEAAPSAPAPPSDTPAGGFGTGSRGPAASSPFASLAEELECGTREE